VGQRGWEILLTSGYQQGFDSSFLSRVKARVDSTAGQSTFANILQLV